MIEILPNWHPIFVHFTIALFSMSALFFCLAKFASRYKISDQYLVVARWCLWMGAFITIGTVIAGFYAYYTVAHDTPSHLAMIDHRNWAIATFVVILVLALWSILDYRAKKNPNLLFIVSILFGLGLLMSTAWHGGELVYRHGIGVMSLPEGHGVGHDHEHDHTRIP